MTMSHNACTFTRCDRISILGSIATCASIPRANDLHARAHAQWRHIALYDYVIQRMHIYIMRCDRSSRLGSIATCAGVHHAFTRCDRISMLGSIATCANIPRTIDLHARAHAQWRHIALYGYVIQCMHIYALRSDIDIGFNCYVR